MTHLIVATLMRRQCGRSTDSPSQAEQWAREDVAEVLRLARYDTSGAIYHAILGEIMANRPSTAIWRAAVDALLQQITEEEKQP